MTDLPTDEKVGPARGKEEEDGKLIEGETDQELAQRWKIKTLSMNTSKAEQTMNH